MAGNACKCCGQIVYPKAQEVAGEKWRMLMGDCLRVMRSMPDKSVDAIITDPPYGSGGMTANDRLRTSKDKYVNASSSYASTLPDIDGDSLLPEVWAEQMKDWTKECRRVLVDDGMFVTFIDWRNYSHLMQIVTRSGIRVRGAAVWNKGQAARPYRGAFRAQTEFVLWGGVGKVQRDDIYLPGVFDVATKTADKVHITEKPVDLMRQLVKVCRPGGLILDPFAGSGSTGVAALMEGYRFIGIESVAGYFETAVNRLSAVRSP